MGDATSGPIRLSFNPQLRIEFRGATVTSDAGLLLPRELDERLGLDALIERHLTDPRSGHNLQFPLPDLFRQSIYSRLAGYADTNDADRLAEDPTFRMLASGERPGVRYAIRLPANDVLERSIERSSHPAPRPAQLCRRWSGTGALSIKPPHGADLDGSSPRSSI